MENAIGNNNSNKNQGVFIALLVVHCVGWLLFGFLFMIYLMFNLFDLYTGFLGDSAAAIIFIIASFCALSPLYLFFIKKKWVKYLIVYIITAVFAIFFFVSAQVSKNYFSKFAKEKWLEYPQLRFYMLDDLKENHGLLDMDENGVIELLGQPDTKNEMTFAYYAHKVNKDSIYIEIKFQEGKAVSVEYRYLL